MKIISLTENTSCRPDIGAEHGLCLYIEANGRKILFDTGQSGLFAENAAKLGVDLTAVDTAVISHGHYDHGGGLETFFRVNQTAPVYISQYAFQKHYNKAKKDIGLDEKLQESGRLHPTGDRKALGDGLMLYSCNEKPRPYPFPAFGLCTREGGRFAEDRFIHEQYLAIEENGRRVLISGCSHKGILNIESWFVPDVLVGGFHLMKIEPDSAGREQLRPIAEQLLTYPTSYYTCHCTGVEQYKILKEYMGSRLQYLSAGSTVEI